MAARSEGGGANGNSSGDVSSTRLYLGNLPRNATRQDVEQHFAKHGGEIVEIKLMSGFGFIEYKDPLDARDVVPAFHGTTFMGERLIVQFARGSRRNENFAHQERPTPRPRRTIYRVAISGLPVDTSWQDLKDFARQPGLDVVYSDIDRSGKGLVEFETASDMNIAAEKLNSTEFKGQVVRCVAEQQDARNDRYRSRSPGPRRGYPPAPDDYDYRRPPRGYSPSREYRRRTPPPPRDWYENRDRYARPPSRGPPPRGGPMDDYPPPRRYPDDPYAPPATRRYDYPEMNGYGAYPRGPYGPPSPGRRRSPVRNGYADGYERRGHW